MVAITIGGLAGGGGRALGPAVAQTLGADYVDRLILTDVARHVGATVEALHQREERPPTRGERFARILQRILERSAVTGAGGDPYFGPSVAAFLTEEYEELPQPTITRGHELEDESYIDALRKVMADLVESGNVVIVGRGGHIILKDDPRVLRIGVVASLDDRIATIVAREHLSREDAESTIAARDKARAYHFSRFFGIGEPDGAALYHLVINTSEMSLELAADLVVQAAKALEEGKLARTAATPAV